MTLNSILAGAIRGLREEEGRLERDLDAVRQRIDQLTTASRLGSGGRGPGRPMGTRKRGMSAAGRAAISRAAKRRWAAWRRAKGKR